MRIVGWTAEPGIEPVDHLVGKGMLQPVSLGVDLVRRHAEGVDMLLRLLSPIVPHITHTLWAALGHTDAVLDSAWPVVDQSALVQESITLVVQVNGKVRGRVDVPADAARETIEAVVLAEDNVQKHMDGKSPRKVIVVPGKLVNIVV